jgi:maleylpyruvate isomerase
VARPTDDLDLLASATKRLLATVRECDDEDLRGASLLPGWSVGHVLSHLAHNADSHTRRLEGAIRGEVVAQYEGGREARDAAIDAGAARVAGEIIEDLVAACNRLDRVLATIPDDVWDRSIVQREYFTAPAATLPFTRVMEVEVHHVDLGLGYGPGEWPVRFTDRALPTVIDRLERRGANVSGREASWHLHRSNGEGEWVIRRGPEGSTVTAEHAKADCAIRGGGAQLLVWLLGRLDAEGAGLEIFGDMALASELPLLYPYG